MKELIKVNWSNETVLASDLWAFLGEPHGRFDMWSKRMLFNEKYHFEDGRDFTSVHKSVHIENTNLKRESTDYQLSLDCAKHLAMLSDTDKGWEAREYFLKCEKMIKQAQRIMSDRQMNLFDFPETDEDRERRIKTLSGILNAISGKGFNQDELKLLTLYFANQLGINLQDDLLSLKEKRSFNLIP